MNPNSHIGSAGWAERFGTTAIVAWWLLTVGSIFL